MHLIAIKFLLVDVFAFVFMAYCGPSRAVRPEEVFCCVVADIREVLRFFIFVHEILKWAFVGFLDAKFLGDYQIIVGEIFVEAKGFDFVSLGDAASVVDLA